MILLLGIPTDTVLMDISSKLRKKNVDSISLNPAQFPTESEISTVYSSNGQQQSTLRWNSEIIDLNTLDSILEWHSDYPKPHQKFISQPLEQAIFGDAWRAFNDILMTLDVQWFPGTHEKVIYGQYKILQLKAAGDLGFALPPTLITNQPDELLSFYTEHNGNIISKILGTTFLKTMGTTFSRYTEPVSKRDIGYAHSIRYCPMIFQAYIPKRAELRITVVGKQVFTAIIDSQGSNRTRYDWRHYDDYATNYQPYVLPDEIEKQCIQLVEKMELTYGAIDMILTPDGRYVFLEINPAGQYGWIEETTGMPITDAICDLLISGK